MAAGWVGNFDCTAIDGLIAREISYRESSYATRALTRYASEQFVSKCPEWVVCKRVCPFSRRITGLSWHPQRLNVVALGSHGGDISVWNINDPTKDIFLPGQGPGGSITEMSFHPTDHRYMYTTSVNGTFSMQDLEGRCSQVYLDTMDWKYWYCTLALSSSHTIMFAGTSYGEGSLVSRSGEKISSHRFHKKKIQHSAFVPNSDELFITASNDYTIKLWDVRMINDTKPTPLVTYNTPAASNSAYFDPFYGSLLLVTCQNSSLLVYNVNSSATSTSPVAEFKHFHKFFQHLTPIKATWHPLFPNLAVVGRYGGMDEEGEERFVDIVDWTKGEVVAKYRDMSALGVVSLNEFNLTGDTLVSGMGRTALAWRRRSTMESFQPSSATGRMSTSSRRGTRSRQGQQPRTTQRKSKKEKFLDSHKLTKSQRSALAKKLHLS